MNSKQLVTYILLCTAILLSAFCLEIGFFPFIPDTIVDYRHTKEFLALVFSTAIFLWATNGGHKINCKNPWLAGLVFYLITHPFLSPKYSIPFLGTDVGGFWEYQAIATTLIYFGVFCVISNLQWTTDFIKGFFKMLMWIGSLSAGYILLQYFKLDQFQHIYNAGFAHATHGGSLTGTFTQPNYSGSFIALMIPFAIYFRRWWHVLLMGSAVILITSKMGMFIMFLGIFVFCFSRRPILSICLLPIFSFILPFIKDADSGRYALWHKIILECGNAKGFPIFGHSLGYYHSIWALSTPGAMMEAHNEWLQLWMDGGLVACGLLLFSIFWLIKRLNIFRIKDDQTVTLLACFIGSLGGSCGLFIWQIEPHRLLTVVIFALLHRKLTTEE